MTATHSVQFFDGAVTLEEDWVADEQRFVLTLRLRAPESGAWTDHRFDLPAPGVAVGDFDFLVGRWHVRHRRVLDPVGQALGRPSERVEFDGMQTGWTFCAGAVSVDETTLREPGRRGLAFRVRDALTREWSIYWVDSRSGRLEPPVHGGFRDGVGTFFGREELSGYDVEVRFLWSDITPTSARWRQAFRIGDGDWAENWEMIFTRASTP